MEFVNVTNDFHLYALWIEDWCVYDKHDRTSENQRQDGVVKQLLRVELFLWFNNS